MNGAVDVPRILPTRGLADTALTLGLTATALTPASAAREMGYWTGDDYADCVAWQRSLTSSWSRVSELCTRSGNGRHFTLPDIY